MRARGCRRGGMVPISKSSFGLDGLVRRLSLDQRGFTRVESFVIFMAFLLLGGGFLFLVLNTSILASEQSRTAVLGGLELTGQALTVQGTVEGLTNSDKTALDLLKFQVSNASTRFERVDLSSNRTIFRYIDSEKFRYIDSEKLESVKQPYWSATWVIGHPQVLDPGETVVFKLNLRDINLAVGPSQEFILQLSPDEGPTLTMRLKTPSRYRNFTLELQPEVKPVETGN